MEKKLKLENRGINVNIEILYHIRFADDNVLITKRSTRDIKIKPVRASREVEFLSEPKNMINLVSHQNIPTRALI